MINLFYLTNNSNSLIIRLFSYNHFAIVNSLLFKLNNSIIESLKDGITVVIAAIPNNTNDINNSAKLELTTRPKIRSTRRINLTLLI